MKTRFPNAVATLLMASAMPAFAAGPTTPTPLSAAAPGTTQARTLVIAPAATASVKLDVGTSIGTYGAPATLRATLTSANGPLAGKSITFFIDDKNVDPPGSFAFPSPTGPDGKAEKTITVNTDLSVGEHVIKAHFPGEAGIPPATATGKLSILKAATNMESVNAAIANNGAGSQPPKPTLVVNGKLFRITDSRGLDGRAVNIVLNGVKIGTAATDASGRFSFSEEWTKGGGIFNLSAEFNGDTHYTASAKSDSTTYSPPPPPPPPKVLVAYRSAPTIAPLGPMMVGGQALMAVKVSLDKEGKSGIPNINVNLYIPVDGPQDGNSHSMTKSVVSNPNGLASATIPLNVAGKHWFASNISDPIWKDGSANDSPQFTQTYLEIAKAPINININGPKSARIGDKIAISIDVKNAAFGGPAPKVEIAAAESASATSATASTVADVNGKATLHYTVPAGIGIGATHIHFTIGSRNFLEKKVSHPITISPKDN